MTTDLSRGALLLKVLWISLRLLVVLALAREGSYFVYQGF